MSSIEFPEFGAAQPGANYILRPGGYAIIFNEIGEIALSATAGGCHLPGGGQDQGEELEQTAVRETEEECGLVIHVLGRLGTADELVYAVREATYFRKRCTFFLADVIGEKTGCETDHQLVWVPVEQALYKLVHGSHRWAVSKASRWSSRY